MFSLVFKCCIGIILGLVHVSEGRQKIYYLAIQEIIWDYAPSGLNLVTNNQLKDEPIANVFTNLYIGKRYKKAVYRRFTDETYETQIPHDPNLGFMGPTIRAEVGDTITVHLFNNASRPFTIHPHGVFYTKANEGARYSDNNTELGNEGVPSGGHNTYTWQVLSQFGPAENDSNCLTWAYHSHVISPKDINSGLIGTIIVCRPGTYNEDESRIDVDHEFVGLFFEVDEQESWYFWENLRTIPNWYELNIDTADDFGESNKMHVINGYIYANTPGYNVCQGETISWHMHAMGTNGDLHPFHFQGQTIMKQNHRKDSLILIPATFSTSLMRANNPGRWYIACMLYNHFTEGMIAWLTVDSSCQKQGVPLPSESLDGITREYFIAIEEIWWDYAPSGMNLMDNESLVEPNSDSSVFFSSGPDRIGGTYKKAVFREYTDESFSETIRPISENGFLGPVIAGEIGDIIKIYLRNNAPNKAFNVEPQGVYFQDTYAVPPNSARTFTWTLPDDVSPSNEDFNCITYIYTSSVSYIQDSNAGLIGPLLVCKRGTLQSELAKEHKYIFMTVFDENKSWYFGENIERFTSDSEIDLNDEDFQESNLMHSINGLMYGNLKLDICSDKNTTVHVMAVGSAVDVHGINLEGINIKADGVNTGVAAVFAHTFETIVIQPHFQGIRRMYCRTIDHLITGMSGLLNSTNCNPIEPDNLSNEEQNVTTTYYIAAEEVIWDYNPSGVNIDGQSTDIKGVSGYLQGHHQPGVLIGSRYKKVLYYEYTDVTFTSRKSKPEHLGAFGPFIKGEVGHTIRVVFYNKANRSYNMFPWGAENLQSNSETDNEPVQPGQTKQYYWTIPDSASPSENQPACQSFVYLSNVDPAIDPIDGLIGPLLVCKQGSFPNGIPPNEPVNVDEEFFLLFLIFDENLSHYLNDNIEMFLEVDPENFEPSEDFEESNKMTSINGRLWHVNGLRMMQNDHVRWHLIGWGNEEDYHSVHFHANTYIHVSEGSFKGDVFNVYPGFIGTIEMLTVAAGDWLLHCHVFNHIHDGMEAIYTVLPVEAMEENDLVTMIPPSQRRCVVNLISDEQEINCDGLNIRNLQDISTQNFNIPVRFPNGTNAILGRDEVYFLSLKNNHLTTWNVRRILRQYVNLRKIVLDGNSLVKIPISFLLDAPNLIYLSAKRNYNLTRVPKTLLSLPSSSSRFGHLQVLDLTENNHLVPSCLNQIFTSSVDLINCFKFSS